MPALTLSPLPASKLPGVPKLNIQDANFGRVATGVDLSQDLTQEQLEDIKAALYTHSVLVFPGANLSPDKQYALTKAFDPTSESYGHGNNKTGGQSKSILHPDLKTIPSVPQVQLIGSGRVPSHHGLTDVKLKHPHHATFHRTRVPAEEDASFTRFYRWHIDAALYDLSPPRVTSLYALRVPSGPAQVCRWDDGSGEELPVPKGTTAFVSGRAMFNALSLQDKSMVVRTRVEYAPHPYVWMAPAASNSVGLGIESENKELDLASLDVDKSKIKILPMAWKNPHTGELHLQIHPSAVLALHIAPLPHDVPRKLSDGSDAPFPDGAHISDLKTVREMVYALQRPAIKPDTVYAHDWNEKDLCLFHNSGVLHTVVGAFEEAEVRMFHQCNLAASSDPEGPNDEDVAKWA